MVALVYAKYLSEDPRSTVVRKSQVIAHSGSRKGKVALEAVVETLIESR